MHSFGYVLQNLTLIREISSHLVEELVAVIFTPIADHLIILFLFFFILIHHEVLVIVERRVHVTFKHEVS